MTEVNQRRSVTPPVNTEGQYSVYRPFLLNAQLTYRCDAIRSFSELALRNIDVFEQYYKPKNIPLKDFELDVDLKASIITLISSDGEIHYIPDTYIEAYPGMAGIPYQRMILMVELGPLPATVDVSYMLPQLTEMVAGVTGTQAEIKLGTVPLEAPLTHEQHHQLEAARRGALAQRTTAAEQLAALSARNDMLTKQVDELMAIIASRPEFAK